MRLAKPSAADLRAAAGGRIRDVIGPGLDVLFCGINPGLYSAATGCHFARPGNRFWPAIHRAGIVDHQVDASRGMSPRDIADLEGRGVAITNLVNEATARADELTADQLRAGGQRLRETVRRVRPRVVAVLGLTAYRKAFADKGARTGRHADGFEGAELWVLPNPSGLNAHETLDSLARAYREVAEAAGVIPGPARRHDGR